MDDMTIERWQDPEAPDRLDLRLAGSMTISQAAELRDVLVAALKETSDLRVDLSGVSQIDLTGLQLLDASHRSAMTNGKRFSVAAGGNRSYLDAVVGGGFRRHVGCSRDKNCSCIWVGGEC
jgi:ABC-type transporter Mla MlaB component